MSEKNDETSALVIILALIYSALVFLFMAIAAILVFAAFVFTLIALSAWNQPRQFAGLVITPEEARGFVQRGLCGAVVFPAFVLFTDVFFALGINWSYLPYIVVAGYTLGSIGIEIMLADAQTETPAAPPLPPPPTIELEATVVRPDPAPKPFRFASWDDEEELQ